MFSLLLLAFGVQLAIHVVNTVGASTINEILWALYTRLPTPTAKDASEAARLRRDVVKLKRELGAISAQDEFTRWAKLRRQLDKAVAEQEKSAASVQATKAKFDTAVNTLRWLGTTGLRFLLQFWYSKQPMFWIPHGWVPGYVEWILAFPRAPTGSISMQVWWIACASVIAMVSEAATAGHTLFQREKAGKGLSKDPMAFKAASKTNGEGAASEKKEL